MARDGLYRKKPPTLAQFLDLLPTAPWDAPSATAPLADLAAVRDAAAGHGRLFGAPAPDEEGGGDPVSPVGLILAVLPVCLLLGGVGTVTRPGVPAPSGRRT